MVPKVINNPAIDSIVIEVNIGTSDEGVLPRSILF